MVGKPPACRIRSITAWMVVPLSQTSSTTRMRWPRRSGSAGNWRKVGCGPGPAVVVVELDRGHQDVPDPEAVGEHPGRDEAAAGDRQQKIERLPGEPFGQAGDEAVELVPGDDVAPGWCGLHRPMIPTSSAGRAAARQPCLGWHALRRRDVIDPAVGRPIAEQPARMVDREQGLASLDRPTHRDGREHLGHQVGARARHDRVGGRDDRDLGALDRGLQGEPRRRRHVARIDVPPQVPLAQVRVVPVRREERVIVRVP